jgi:release factor glutamine methyltransferase
VDRWTIGALLDTTAGYLRDKGSDSSRLDAELLLAEALGLERIGLYTEYDRPLTSPELDRYRALVRRRARHEPVAYILGRAYFRRLCLEVSPAVLIPRPETEELVDAALELLRLRPAWEACAGTARETPPTLIADVGTGSGAIALSLAQETGLRVLATDASAEALQVAGRNRAALGLERLVELSHADLLTEVGDHSLHLVVSNPPYVTSGDMGALAPDIRLHEPASALEAGEDGLAVFRLLVPEAARVLRPGGSVLLEVGDGQAPAVGGLAGEAGFTSVAVRKDLSGKERIVAATLPGATLAPLGSLDETQRTALVDALAGGAVIGVPTDTVYGIAARWDSRSGVHRLSVAKGRSSDQPMATLFPSAAAIEATLPDVNEPSLKVLKALLPGPFTFVIGTTVVRPPLVGAADSLGVRVPDHPALLEFLASLETPLAATSANLSGGKEAALPSDVDPVVLAHCSIAFMSPESPSGAEPSAASTVVDLRPLASGGAALILREGAADGAETLERIGAVL